jgi:hypothetical protein
MPTIDIRDNTHFQKGDHSLLSIVKLMLNMKRMNWCLLAVAVAIDMEWNGILELKDAKERLVVVDFHAVWSAHLPTLPFLK